MTSSLFDQLKQRDSLAPRLGGRDLLPGLSDRLAWCLITVIFGILIVLGPIIAVATSDGATEGSIVRQISYLVLLLASIFVSQPWTKGWRLLAVPLPLALAFLWFAISLSWSIAPGIGFRRLLLTMTVAWTCVIIVHNTGYRQTLDNLRISLAFCLLMNYVAVLLFPETGLQDHAESWTGDMVFGAWRGVMTDKNLAGAEAALCFLFFFFDAKAMPFALRIATLLLSSFFLYKTHSKTSIGLTVVSVALGVAFERIEYRIRVYLVPITVVLATVVGTLMVASRFGILQQGLSPTALTGRGSIWNVIIKYAMEHFWTGSGYGSFWNVGGLSPVFTYGQGFVITLSVGHNGYLDLWAATGLPGVLLGVYAVMVWPMIKLLGSEKISLSKGAFLCAVLMFTIGHNMTESSLLDRDALTGAIAIFIACITAYSLPINKRSGKSRRRHRGESSGQEKGQQLLDEMKTRKLG